MADIWVVLVTMAFFGMCVALVWGCDRIIGPDDALDLGADGAPDGAGDAAAELAEAGR
jgi:hypothetical protein